MAGGQDSWRALSEEMVDALPETAGVFTLGNLVRSVLLVSADGGDGVRAAVRAALSRSEIRAQARCVRVELSEDPARREAEILAAYGDAHSGSLPPAQMLQTPPGHARVAHLERTPRPRPARYAPTSEATFLRRRTVA